MFDRVLNTSLFRIIFYPILDTNECEAGGKNVCHVKANCYNTIGSYYCQCNPGWKGNGTDCESELKSAFLSTQIDFSVKIFYSQSEKLLKAT